MPGDVRELGLDLRAQGQHARALVCSRVERSRVQRLEGLVAELVNGVVDVRVGDTLDDDGRARDGARITHPKRRIAGATTRGEAGDEVAGEIGGLSEGEQEPRQARAVTRGRPEHGLGLDGLA